MSKNDGKGRIITGSGEPEPTEDNKEFDIPIPALNHYWVTWFNPQAKIFETVRLSAHTVEIYDDSMLVFKAFTKIKNAALLAAGSPPIVGYYVSSFRNHIRFGQEIPEDAKDAGQVH